LLKATEKILNEWSQQIIKRAEKGKPFTDAEIGIRVGKFINKYHVSKHAKIKFKKNPNTRTPNQKKKNIR
jgi:hypothetical protein